MCVGVGVVVGGVSIGPMWCGACVYVGVGGLGVGVVLCCGVVSACVLTCAGMWRCVKRLFTFVKTSPLSHVIYVTIDDQVATDPSLITRGNLLLIVSGGQVGLPWLRYRSITRLASGSGQ